MDFILQPWQLFFMILAGWVNREQQAAIGTGMRIAGAFSIYFTGSEVSFAFPSPLL